MATILDLPELLRELEQDIFQAEVLQGRLVVPSALAPKIARWYGRPGGRGPDAALARACEQRVVKTFNAYTFEGAQFNERRAERPVAKPDTRSLAAFIEDAKEECDFCDPLNMTCADVWGRIEGKDCITAANAAKYDANHGMVIFGPHHPHAFDREHIQDYVQTALQWLNRTHKGDRNLRYPFIMWNCLGSAGASLVHGHLHMLLNPYGFYARHASLVSATHNYQERCQTGNQTRSRTRSGDYWRDWTAVHREVGLAVESGDVVIAAAITPVKEKEVVILDFGFRDMAVGEGAMDALTTVLRAFLDDESLAVLSFNVGIYLRPFEVSNYRLPLIIRCVDRGDPSPLPSGKSKTSDVGGMELYGSSVVSFDPFKVIAAIKRHMGNV
ncbi:MAG: hypothetical protein JW993_21100 [Sedimentisphaerales bacterium]|nr:hypothetical protein [Sedimentisphaerales bacterium]